VDSLAVLNRLNCCRQLVCSQSRLLQRLDPPVRKVVVIVAQDAVPQKLDEQSFVMCSLRPALGALRLVQAIGYALEVLAVDAGALSDGEVGDGEAGTGEGARA